MNKILCDFCETEPASIEEGDWQLCPRCYNELMAGPEAHCCAECGQPLSAEDVEAGETICLDCAGAEFMAEIDLESPLLATVAVRLKELK